MASNYFGYVSMKKWNTTLFIREYLIYKSPENLLLISAQNTEM
jgi:hypothetical protein